MLLPKGRLPEMTLEWVIPPECNAVERNRVKRRLRAAAAEVFPSIGRAGTDYVVVGRAATLKRPFDALKADLEQAIRRLDGGPKAAPRPKEALQ